MSLIWTKASGYSFGTIQERVPYDQALPVANDFGYEYSIIAGLLPKGLKLYGNRISGVPFEVTNPVEYSFCIRATKDQTLYDRTFKITVEGNDFPEFITPSGSLDIGPNHQLFTLDNTEINYQIQAYDTDSSAGQQLVYFIDGGELPSGLTLTEQGIITGIINPVTSLVVDEVSTSLFGYETLHYDETPFDFFSNTLSSSSLTRTYEFIVSISDSINVNKRPFRIVVIGSSFFRADNIDMLADEEEYTSDVTYMTPPIWVTPSNLGLYRADTYATILLNTRPNNFFTSYQIEQINIETLMLTYSVEFTDNIENQNNLSVSSDLIPNVNDYISLSSMYYSKNWQDQIEYVEDTLVRYQDFVYICKYTHESNDFTNELANEYWGLYDVPNQITNVEILNDNYYRLRLKFPLTSLVPNDIPFYAGTLSRLLPSVTFNQNNGDLYGRITYLPIVNETYKFTVNAINVSPQGETADSMRLFTAEIVGEIDNTIIWLSDSDLGIIKADFETFLHIKAKSLANLTTLFSITNGFLPAGLKLHATGEISGKVTQIGNWSYRSAWQPQVKYYRYDVVLNTSDEIIYQSNLTHISDNIFDITKWTAYNISETILGIIRFFEIIDTENNKIFTTLDSGSTTFDRTYNFDVTARNSLSDNISTKNFYLTVEVVNEIDYSNITVKPFLPLTQRKLWNDFITDSSVFSKNLIFRANDPDYGVQKDLKMIVFAGIETTESAKYVSAMGRNHKRKRFNFGSVKKAQAVIPGTRTVVYEVVYIEMIDPLEPSKRKLPSTLVRLSGSNIINSDNRNILWTNNLTDLAIPAPRSPRPCTIVSSDSEKYLTSDSNPTMYHPNSISNWRDRFLYWTDVNLADNTVQDYFETERNYLPLWMRSIQYDWRRELDYVPAVTLAYCTVGSADRLMLNIKNYLKTHNFNFNMLDYTIERYTIDAVARYPHDKYLVFKHDRTTI